MGVEEFGDRVRRLRERAGWSQTDLAAQSGLSFQTIQGYEGKKSTTVPRRLSVIKLARALGWDIDEALTLLGHELLDDEERAAYVDVDKQRLDALWLRLSDGQRSCLVDFLETMVSPQPQGKTGWGKRITPGSGTVPPPRNDNNADESHNGS